tara:strand:- start:326 stop:757 length:432 start_codon:yes stop_codon:yes gene_type:complete
VEKTINWKCRHTWPKAMKNTLWCLMGCSIGDFGTILFFQVNNIEFPLLAIMVLAIINGLITSILLETIILTKELGFQRALKTAIGMSLISMISMEVSMNLIDFIATGGAVINIWIIPIMLLFGFITPLPYNYWRLKKFGIACH